MRHIVLLSICALSLIGCGSSNEGDNVAVPTTEMRVTELVKKSGGNWDALSDADKRDLIQSLGQGNEQTARVSFAARTSKNGPPSMGGR